MTADARIRIEKVTVKELAGYASRFFAPDYHGPCPITPKRAAAHAANPAAAPDDVALLVAYSGEQVVGYMGILPGWWRNGGERRKVYWLTALYVVPTFERTVAGASLVFQAMKLGYDLVTS
jgi:hypothetical protein